MYLLVLVKQTILCQKHQVGQAILILETFLTDKTVRSRFMSSLSEDLNTSSRGVAGNSPFKSANAELACQHSKMPKFHRSLGRLNACQHISSTILNTADIPQHLPLNAAIKVVRPRINVKQQNSTARLSHVEYVARHSISLPGSEKYKRIRKSVKNSNIFESRFLPHLLPS